MHGMFGVHELLCWLAMEDAFYFYLISLYSEHMAFVLTLLGFMLVKCNERKEKKRCLQTIQRVESMGLALNERF